MRVYDPEGEYTSDEVLQALTGSDNSRRISFRYERLDSSNKKIEDIDYVSSCTIDNNFLADIKRTATVDMYDTGSFNFLQDRLKPYVRVEMPKDKNYFETMRLSAPAIWYKLDEGDIGADQSTNYPLGGTTSMHTTLASGYPLDTSKRGSHTLSAEFPVNGARTTLVAKTATVSGRPLKTTFKASGTPSAEVYISYRILYGTVEDGSDATLVSTGLIDSTTGYVGQFIDDSPQAGWYFAELTVQKPATGMTLLTYSIVMGRLYPISDSSEHHAHGLTSDFNFGGLGLINNAVASTQTTDSGNYYPGGWAFAGTAPSSEVVDGKTVYSIVSSDSYTATNKVPARVGDLYYAEFAMKDEFGVGLTKPTHSVALQITNAAGAVIGGEDRAETSKIRNLSNGWALYGATIGINRNAVGAAFVQLQLLPYSRGWAFIDPNSIRLVRRASLPDGSGVGSFGRSIQPAPNKPQTWDTSSNLNIKLDKSISVNFWQRLSAVRNAFRHTFRFTVEGGYIDIKALHTKGAAASFEFMVVSTDTYDPFTYSAKISIPEARFNDIDPHMMTLMIDPVNGRSGVFKDGSLLGWATLQSGSVAISRTESMFANGYITKASMGFEAATSVNLIDDITVHSAALPEYRLRDLYSIGRNSKPLRRGYVEWPQGVFLLSAPSRTMTKTGGVVRNIAAYDQLLALKEDSFLDRFSIAKGVRYTDMIDYIIRTTQPKNAFTARSGVWPNINNANVSANWIGEDSLTLANSVSNTWLEYDSNETVLLRGVSVSTRIDAISTNWTLSIAKAALDVRIQRFGTTLEVRDSTNTVVYTTTFSSTTHRYVRLRELNGKISAERSTDGTTWVVMIATDPPAPFDDPSSAIRVGFGLWNPSGSSSTGVFNRIMLDGEIVGRPMVAPNAAVLPDVREWEPGTPKLTIVNDLLDAINYDSASFDEDGNFIAQPYTSPTLRPSEYTYRTDASSVISGDVNQTIDLFNVPNAWVLIASRPEAPPLVARYVNDNPNSITSTIARGRIITDVREENDITVQATLNAKVIRVANEASQIYERIEFNTALMPFHQNSDVYDLEINGLAVKDKYSELSWSMELSPGSLMRHTVRRSVAI